MKRLAFLLTLILAGCGTLPPPGNYIVQPISGPITPEYTYCSYGDCWNFVFSDTVFQPTQENFPTEVPTIVPVPTSLPTCVIESLTNDLRVRREPWGLIIGSLNLGDKLASDATKKATDGSIWYRIYWTPDTPGYVISSFVKVATSADCSRIPQL